MLVETTRLAAALHLPAGAEAHWEPLGASPPAPWRVVLSAAGDAGQRVVVVRPCGDDAAQNHAAVLEALTNAGFPGAPRLLGFVDGCSVEDCVDGLSALAVEPPPGSCEAAIEVLAALHAMQVREGLRWGATPYELFPPEEIPLHRLGFAAHEREPARAGLAAVHRALLESPFGFVHGDATAAHVLLRPGAATLVRFDAAGYGPQLFDVAAFLLTSGLHGQARRALALRYAAARSLPGAEVADLVDLLGITWGVYQLLALPRQQVMAMGDDVATHRLATAAARIERGLRTPAGDHPAARTIRLALWPA